MARTPAVPARSEAPMRPRRSLPPAVRVTMASARGSVAGSASSWVSSTDSVVAPSTARFRQSMPGNQVARSRPANSGHT